MAFELPQLPYKYNALEPHIDAKTMEIHHSKHHQGYVDKLNNALADYPDWHTRPIEEILKSIDQIPEDVLTAVRNNGGGHHNHSLFWNIMTPEGGGEPIGEIAKAIDKTFESSDKFKEKFSETAKNQFGSGWAWLVSNNGNLEIMSTPNQDSPLMENKIPIMGLDVWEHAYYLKHQNKRADYINTWWNLINWVKVDEYYKQVISE